MSVPLVVRCILCYLLARQMLQACTFLAKHYANLCYCYQFHQSLKYHLIKHMFRYLAHRPNVKKYFLQPTRGCVIVHSNLHTSTLTCSCLLMHVHEMQIYSHGLQEGVQLKYFKYTCFVIQRNHVYSKNLSSKMEGNRILPLSGYHIHICHTK